MRHKRWLVGGFLLLVVGGYGVGNNTPPPAPPRPAPTPAASPATTTAATSPATPTVTAPTATGEQITVAHVIDGDTFDLADGRTVRVLGIDSCEMSTHAGKDAKTAAETALNGAAVTLTAQPGVDRDRYGRILRYVQVNGQDFGVQMVKWDHTGVYQGRNDASPQYLASLYAADLDYALNPPAGRSCDNPYPADTSAGSTGSTTDDGSPRPRARTGRSGHPCLPGERDGDRDGYCGEGR